MNRYVDNMDKSLHEYISSITFDGLSKEEIHGIAMRAKKKQKRNIYKIVAVFLFLVLISITSVNLYKKYTDYGNMAISSKIDSSIDDKINLNIDEKPKAELSNEESVINIGLSNIVDIVIFKSKNGSNYEPNSKGCFNINTDEIFVSLEDVAKLYVVKVEKVLEYSFAMQNPITKLYCSIVKNIKGKDLGNIEITLNGGVISIFELENSNLDYELSDKYYNLSENDKKNTFVRIISDFDYENLDIPEQGKYYIVSLDENNKNISNCKYPFLEFDVEKNLYKTSVDKWRNFEY